MDIGMQTSFKSFPKKSTIALLFLIVITGAVYWPVSNYPFLRLDDNVYVTENFHVRSGINKESVAAAFRFTNPGEQVYYHPLTMLSHMLDVQLFGLNPSGHHLTNVAIHLINVALLFLFLHWSTGSSLGSIMAATFFALHPVNVESVAWIAERKNLLSTTFWLLSCCAYTAYGRRPHLLRYLPVFLLMLLGLLAKPMLVTLPFALLLLDFWPLQRVRLRQPASDREAEAEGVYPKTFIGLNYKLVLEKLPLMVLSVLWVYLASLSAQQSGMVISTQAIPICLRLQNAVYSYFAYLQKLFFPFNLAIFYPFPQEMYPLWEIAGVLLLLLLVTFLAVSRARTAAFWMTGWLWYLGTLVPVLGLKQQGLWPAMADRWLYLPAMGIFIIIAWGIHRTMTDDKAHARIVQGMVMGVVLIMAVLTRNQLINWKDDLRISRQALESTTQNSVAQHLYGLALIDRKQTEKGLQHIDEALKISPFYNTARINLGGILAEQGDYEKAIENLNIALKINPNLALVHNNLGVTFKKMGRLDDAVASFSKAVSLDPYFAGAYNNLANTLKRKGRFGEAVQNYRRALQINNDIPEIHNNIANAYQSLHQPDQAIAHYREAIRLSPRQPVFYINLGETLYGEGDLAGAISNYEAALRLIPNDRATRDRFQTLQRLLASSNRKP